MIKHYVRTVKHPLAGLSRHRATKGHKVVLLEYRSRKIYIDHRSGAFIYHRVVINLHHAALVLYD